MFLIDNSAFMKNLYKKTYKEIGNLFHEEFDAARNIVKDMSKYLSFGEKLSYLLGKEVLNLSNHAVSQLCSIDSHTIKRYKENKSTPDEKNLMRICCGLQLNPIISRYLFIYARKNLFFVLENPYSFYCFILEYFYFLDIKDINKLISFVYPNKGEYLL